jgi:uncharacterized lipoprotein NlpE involved in copper resistance
MSKSIFATTVLVTCFAFGCDDTADALKQEAKAADATLDRAGDKARQQAHEAKRDIESTAGEVGRDVRSAAGEAKRELHTAKEDAKQAVDRADKAIAEGIRD